MEVGDRNLELGKEFRGAAGAVSVCVCVGDDDLRQAMSVNPSSFIFPSCGGDC